MKKYFKRTQQNCGMELYSSKNLNIQLGNNYLFSDFSEQRKAENTPSFLISGMIFIIHLPSIFLFGLVHLSSLVFLTKKRGLLIAAKSSSVAVLHFISLLLPQSLCWLEKPQGTLQEKKIRSTEKFIFGI